MYIERCNTVTEDVLEALRGGQWFSCLDLASGYWQMQVKEEDRPKTVFSQFSAVLLNG